MDSVVFERYGRQQGARKGHNPKKHGRPSHHPLLAVFGELPDFSPGHRHYWLVKQLPDGLEERP